MDLKNMHYCAAMQPSTWDFLITIYKLVKTNLTLQSSFTEKKNPNASIWSLFFLKWKSVGFFCAGHSFREAWQWYREDFRYIKTLDARCSALQQRDSHNLLESFPSFVTDMLSAHILCVPQGYLSSSMECNPLLPWGENMEKIGWQGDIAAWQWYLWLQILLALHRCTALFTVAVPWQGWAFTTAGWNPWPCLPQKSQAPAQRFQQNGWGVIYWGICGPCLLYFKFYCSLST